MSNDFLILVALDFQAGMDRVLTEAERQARAHDAHLVILHVAPPDPELLGYLKSADPQDQAELDGQRKPKAESLRSKHHRTQAIGSELRDKGLRVDEALTVQGPVLATILEQAGKLDADMLILGSHQHGALYRLLIGDTAAQAVLQAPCPLLVVPLG